MMRGTEGGAGSRAAWGVAGPPRTRLNPGFPTAIHQSSDQSVGTHRISDRPISVHRTDVHRTSAQRSGVRAANVHLNNVQGAMCPTVIADHASRQPPVIHRSDVLPSGAQHTSGHACSIDPADVRPASCREPSAGQQVSYPIAREDHHERLTLSDVWLCEEEVEYGAQHHTHKTRFRKTVHRQIWRIAQRVPRPLLLVAMGCMQAILALLFSHRYRAAVLSSLLLLCILLLSRPNVPERFLGIRSPDQVLESFNTPQNNSNKETEGFMQHDKSKQHSVQKRHVPHKFWARAQPNNKFLRKRRNSKLQPNHPQQVKGIYPLEDWLRVAGEAVNTLQ